MTKQNVAVFHGRKTLNTMKILNAITTITLFNLLPLHFRQASLFYQQCTFDGYK